MPYDPIVMGSDHGNNLSACMDKVIDIWVNLPWPCNVSLMHPAPFKLFQIQIVHIKLAFYIITLDKHKTLK